MCTSRKQMSGRMRLEQLDRLAAVARLRHDLELRPGLRELARERLAQQRLVVGDQRGRALARHVAAPPRAGKSSSAHDAVRLLRAQAQLRVAAEDQLQALAQRRRVRCRARRRPPAGPTPVSLTRTRQRPSRRCTWTSMRPPSSLGSMPWRTAFSTSVSSVIGGQRSASAASSTCSVELQAVGHAHVHQLEVGAHQLQLLAQRGGRLVQARHRGAQVGDQAVAAPRRPAANRRRPAPARWPAC